MISTDQHRIDGYHCTEPPWPHHLQSHHRSGFFVQMGDHHHLHLPKPRSYVPPLHLLVQIGFERSGEAVSMGAGQETSGCDIDAGACRCFGSKTDQGSMVRSELPLRHLALHVQVC
ncbi:hypothetical protein HanXRQr2_Chr02g0056751 [Helianthus annuus]|uniref:Uncharacterized protein n=1 Tax=Helianthus annuus TaxID=4232 RepID=A0A9K3JM78_HELAN|nr:hypothetical protein HanXRQr2_Chr02g0056751 [Helianthus annuus]KAJ0951112.1 hypothetical protein HanPSC8_Chr02g0056161 [Helianthus annuus]